MRSINRRVAGSAVAAAYFLRRPCGSAACSGVSSGISSKYAVCDVRDDALSDAVTAAAAAAADGDSADAVGGETGAGGEDGGCALLDTALAPDAVAGDVADGGEADGVGAGELGGGLPAAATAGVGDVAPVVDVPAAAAVATPASAGGGDSNDCAGAVGEAGSLLSRADFRPMGTGELGSGSTEMVGGDDMLPLHVREGQAGRRAISEMRTNRHRHRHRYWCRHTSRDAFPQHRGPSSLRPPRWLRRAPISRPPH
jgi:hypothetical protein